MSPCLNLLETADKSCSKAASNDYESLPKPAEYASALGTYSNIIRESYYINSTSMLECSEMFNVSSTSTNDDEEVYSDPGHSEAAVYACFERKRFRKIKTDDVRYPYHVSS